MLEKKDLDPDLYKNYTFYLNDVPEIFYEGTHPFLSCEDVLDAHYLIGNHFLKKGEGMGGFGPKDFGLLSSAVARQLTSVNGEYVYKNIWETASSLIFGLVNDHPFYDANKRTAFLCAVFLMLENGYMPSVDIQEVEEFTVCIAEYHSKNGRHMDISEISPKFKTMFRKKDSRIYYVVTFNELKSILSNHNCSLRNPQRNYIDVYKEDYKVAQIGFPGWKKEATRNAISTVRKATGLTADNGYDAQVFFKSADPLSILIGEYEEPLKRLADR